MSIAVIYEDQYLLVANKPSGMLSVPTPRNETNTLTDILNEELKKSNDTCRLHPCHRLDRDTSGLIIYAKGKSAQKKIMDYFREKKIKKTYLAFISGHPEKHQAEITYPIEGKSALTRYRVIERRKGFSVAEAFPFTGRTNQIRIHFKRIGHPILGEDRFAFRRDFKVKAKKLCLHACGLEFEHPYTKKNISLTAPLPKHMQELLEKGE